MKFQTIKQVRAKIEYPNVTYLSCWRNATPETVDMLEERVHGIGELIFREVYR